MHHLQQNFCVMRIEFCFVSLCLLFSLITLTALVRLCYYPIIRLLRDMEEPLASLQLWFPCWSAFVCQLGIRFQWFFLLSYETILMGQKNNEVLSTGRIHGNLNRKIFEKSTCWQNFVPTKTSRDNKLTVFSFFWILFEVSSIVPEF